MRLPEYIIKYQDSKNILRRYSAKAGMLWMKCQTRQMEKRIRKKEIQLPKLTLTAEKILREIEKDPEGFQK